MFIFLKGICYRIDSVLNSWLSMVMILVMVYGGRLVVHDRKKYNRNDALIY